MILQKDVRESVQNQATLLRANSTSRTRLLLASEKAKLKCRLPFQSSVRSMGILLKLAQRCSHYNSRLTTQTKPESSRLGINNFLVRAVYALEQAVAPLANT